MKQYRYEYQPRKKYTCPNCGQKTLKRFVDTTTGELLADDIGVCERIFSCGYNNRPNSEQVERQTVEAPQLTPFFIHQNVMEQTLDRLNKNTLFNFLASNFNRKKVESVFIMYMVGTSNSGDTIFWQVDNRLRVRSGKKIQYFSDGHRNKARGASWMHWNNGFIEGQHELKQCLFGQHLLSDRYNNIFIVESEKTALICEICKREKDVLFLACGGLQNLGLVSKLKLNTDQKIWLLPDNDANEVWREKIDKLNINAKIKIIPSLQEMKRGSDVGDLLLNLKMKK